eukprot:TRINITY_DN1337_c0_g1_i2.p1 TRINITY_DN1337_c0_g1~~TRINITY_DN1337_c0_g1_i2.p1  ORF type:complete len:499 (+),score=164.73 TRINITY_DN1337_c0_g1_i2:56-1498(+)
MSWEVSTPPSQSSSLEHVESVEEMDGAYSAPETSDQVLRGGWKRARGQWRKRVTGHEHRRVRDHLREEIVDKHLGPLGQRVKGAVRSRVLESENRFRKVKEAADKKWGEQQVMRVLDRLAFTIGVLGIVSSEFILLQHPHYFWIAYIVVMFGLMAARYVLYTLAHMQYFMLDFCYYVQLLCLLQIVWPSETLFRVCFVFGNGPLGWAIVAWRNSLVFHSFDKVTSVYIHTYPMLLTFTWRWRQHCSGADCAVAAWGQEPGWLPFRDALVLPLAAYVVWQIGYLLITEVFGTPRYDRTLTTSLRYLAAQGDKSPTVKFVKGLCVKIGYMKKGEQFDADTLKTKAVIVGFQFVYTVVTILPTFIIYRSEVAHLLFISFCCAMCTWNGAAYYFEVFASSYRHARPRRRASLDRPVKPTVLASPDTMSPRTEDQHVGSPMSPASTLPPAGAEADKAQAARTGPDDATLRQRRVGGVQERAGGDE